MPSEQPHNPAEGWESMLRHGESHHLPIQAYEVAYISRPSRALYVAGQALKLVGIVTVLTTAAIIGLRIGA